MKKVLYYSLSMLALASCTNDDFQLEDKRHDNSGNGFRFEISAAGDPSRAVTDDNFKTTFTDGDAVGVYVVARNNGAEATLAPSGNYADNNKLTLTDGVWVIDHEIPFAAEGTQLDFYAYYPYSESVDPTAIAYNATESMYDLMMAKTTGIEAGDETVFLNFSHQLTLIDARLTAGAGTAITISGLYPAATLNLGAAGSDNVMTITGDKPADIAMTRVERKHFRAYIPAQPTDKGQLSIQASGRTQEYTPVNKDFITGTAYSYNIASSLINLGDLPNCYIVKPGEQVTFPVLKAYEVWRQLKWINNGNLRKDGPVGAELIWQDTQSLIVADGIKVNVDENADDQSTVTVSTTPGVSGNALVAVTMGGDKTWVYHIWVTDFDPDKNTREVDNNGDGVADYVFMDRNLGAMTDDATNPLSIGLYYQGCRNEPFPSTKQSPADDVNVSSITLYDINNTEIHIQTGDIWGPDQGQSTRRVLTSPSLFITSYSEPYSWLTNDGNASYIYGPNFWYEESTGEKGVFDPSPAGWMVPIDRNNKSPWQSVADNGDAVADFLKIYPAGGRIKFNGKFGNTTDVMLWTGTMYGLKQMAFQCSGSWNQVSNYSNGNALNVRCVKIQ